MLMCILSKALVELTVRYQKGGMRNMRPIGRDSFTRDYWNYYLMLERKFVDALAYVELAPTNFSTYSNEFAHLLQAIGAELDSVFKLYCGFKAEDNKNMRDYSTYILGANGYSGIVSQSVNAREYGVSFMPFENWDTATPTWWRAYAHVKHQRADSKEEATLKNTLYVLGALYLMESKCFLELSKGEDAPDIPDNPSAIFELSGWKSKWMSVGNGCFLQSMGEDEIDSAVQSAVEATKEI